MDVSVAPPRPAANRDPFLPVLAWRLQAAAITAGTSWLAVGFDDAEPSRLRGCRAMADAGRQITAFVSYCRVHSGSHAAMPLFGGLQLSQEPGVGWLLQTEDQLHRLPVCESTLLDVQRWLARCSHTPYTPGPLLDEVLSVRCRANATLVTVDITIDNQKVLALASEQGEELYRYLLSAAGQSLAPGAESDPGRIFPLLCGELSLDELTDCFYLLEHDERHLRVARSTLVDIARQLGVLLSPLVLPYSW